MVITIASVVLAFLSFDSWSTRPMRNGLTTLVFGGSLLALAAVATLAPTPARSAPSGGISLSQTLSEWKYPGSEHLGSMSMSDAGIPPMQAVKCEAILTTPNPFDKVVAFYVEKLKKDAPNTVSTQDDSKERPVAQRVIVVNRADTSTTVVVSRTAGEKQTHITWSHYIRLSDHHAKGSEPRVRVSLNIYSGRRDPSWETSDEEAKSFAGKFDVLKVSEVQKPLNPVLGYRGFSVDGFRSYDRVWIWKGTVEATRGDKTYRWKDEGRNLEKYLLETVKAHVSVREYEMAATGVEKK